MVSEKYVLVTVMMVAAAVSSVVARASGVALAQIKDKTICKTVIEYDEDVNRIPRIIKVMKCAPEQHRACRERGAPVSCCQRSTGDNNPHFTCVQVLDTVAVSSRDGHTYTLNVPIGCTCVQIEPSIAKEIQ